MTPSRVQPSRSAVQCLSRTRASALVIPRHASTTATSNSKPANTNTSATTQATTDQASPAADCKTDETKAAKKSVLQQDEELRQRLNAANGDAGVEYEDGQPASMKRSVKNNMFRYI